MKFVELKKKTAHPSSSSSRSYICLCVYLFLYAKKTLESHRLVRPSALTFCFELNDSINANDIDSCYLFILSNCTDY